MTCLKSLSYQLADPKRPAECDVGFADGAHVVLGAPWHQMTLNNTDSSREKSSPFELI